MTAPTLAQAEWIQLFNTWKSAPKVPVLTRARGREFLRVLYNACEDLDVAAEEHQANTLYINKYLKGEIRFGKKGGKDNASAQAPSKAKKGKKKQPSPEVDDASGNGLPQGDPDPNEAPGSQEDNPQNSPVQSPGPKDKNDDASDHNDSDSSDQDDEDQSGTAAPGSSKAADNNLESQSEVEKKPGAKEVSPPAQNNTDTAGTVANTDTPKRPGSPLTPKAKRQRLDKDTSVEQQGATSLSAAQKKEDEPGSATTSTDTAADQRGPTLPDAAQNTGDDSVSAATAAATAANQEGSTLLGAAQKTGNDSDLTKQKKPPLTDVEKAAEQAKRKIRNAKRANILAALNKPAKSLLPLNKAAVDEFKKQLKPELLNITIWGSGSKKSPSRVILGDILASSVMSTDGVANQNHLKCLYDLIIGLFTPHQLDRLRDFHTESRRIMANRTATSGQSAFIEQGGRPVDPLDWMQAHQVALSKWAKETHETLIRRMFGHMTTPEIQAAIYKTYGTGGKSLLAQMGHQARKELGVPWMRHDNMCAITYILYRSSLGGREVEAREAAYRIFAERYHYDVNRGRVLLGVQRQFGPGAIIMLSTYPRWTTATNRASADITEVALYQILQRFPQLQGMFDNLYDLLWYPISTNRALPPGLLGYEVAGPLNSLFDALSTAHGRSLADVNAERSLAYLHEEDLMVDEDEPASDEEGGTHAETPAANTSDATWNIEDITENVDDMEFPPWDGY